MPRLPRFWAHCCGNLNSQKPPLAAELHPTKKGALGVEHTSELVLAALPRVFWPCGRQLFQCCHLSPTA